MEKVRENRLRRMAKAQGYALIKSRARYKRALNFGCYMIIDAFTNSVVAGTYPTGRPDLSLDEVEQWLDGDAAERKPFDEKRVAAKAKRG